VFKRCFNAFDNCLLNRSFIFVSFFSPGRVAAALALKRLEIHHGQWGSSSSAGSTLRRNQARSEM